MDIRLALRSLRHHPGFAVSAIATAALGIGASTAMFSVAYGVSLRPLPFAEPKRLIRIYEANLAEGQLQHDVSIAAFHEWRQQASTLESAALFSKGGTRFLTGDDPRPVTMMRVSPAFFDVLGIRPILGPGFKPEREYTRYTADDEAVVSFAAWKRLFGGRPDVIGRSFEVSGVGDNDSYRIVGVMPESFVFDQPVDMWQPTKIVEEPVGRLLRLWRYDRVVARLRPGATIDQARAELQAISARLATEFPASNRGWTATVESLHDSIIGAFGRAAWLLLAAVAVVLLVTCLNVAGLLIARAVARRRETAVRAALGATNAQLGRLLLAEASLLAGSAAFFGVLLASLGVSSLKAAAPPGIPRLDAIALDLPTLAVAAACTLIALGVFTFAPMVRRREIVEGLRPGSTGAPHGAGRQSARTVLTVAQCAGAATLVILAVMLTRSFVKLTSLDLGWDAAGVLSLSVQPPLRSNRPWFQIVEWSDRLTARLEATPDIESAALTSQIPLSPDIYPAMLGRGGNESTGDDARWSGVRHHVSDKYFRLMGIRLVAGRTFGPEDRFSEDQLIRRTSDQRGVVVVSEAAARALWPGQSAIGQMLWFPDVNVRWREVVGVVEDIQFHAVGDPPALHVFVPWSQFPTQRPRLLVKHAAANGSIAEIVREVVGRVEPGTQIDRVIALDALFARATAEPRLTSRIVAAFGALALLLAAVGIYGTLSYLVGARTREIGIRLALGASQRVVLSDVLSRGVIPAIAGGVIGLAMAVALARTFRALFFDLQPVDAGSFAAGGTLLVIVAIAAALGPALRASRVDPARALREDV